MTQAGSQLPAIPPVNMHRLFSLRDKLTTKVTKFLGHKLVAEEFQALVDSLLEALPAPVKRQTIKNSLMSVLGQELTEPVAFLLCWRLAGNIKRLKRGETVAAWALQRKQEWVLVEVEHVQCQVRRKKHGQALTFRVLTGEPTAMDVIQWWSNKKLGYLATYRDDANNGFGFSRFRYRNGERQSDYPYLDPRQYFGMRFFMLAEPQRVTRDLVLSAIGHNATTMAYNREIMRHRLRKSEAYACPYRYPDTQDCHVCPVGRDLCPAACHTKTYQLGRCPRCKSENVFFDPEERDFARSCVNCCYSLRRA